MAIKDPVIKDGSMFRSQMVIEDTDNANQAMTQSSIVSARSLKFVKGVCELLFRSHTLG